MLAHSVNKFSGFDGATMHGNAAFLKERTRRMSELRKFIFFIERPLKGAFDFKSIMRDRHLALGNIFSGLFDINTTTQKDPIGRGFHVFEIETHDGVMRLRMMPAAQDDE